MESAREEKVNIIQESSAGHFRSRGFGIFLVWMILITAGVGTYFLSRTLNTGSSNAAGAYLSESVSHTVSLYADRAEPSTIQVKPGDEVSFVVKDKSRHNLAEERSKKSDARLESGEFGEGESYSLVFQGKGEFSFYDRQNQDIRITIFIE